MEKLPENRNLRDVVPAIILLGCFGGICLAVMVIFLQGIWAPVLDYNVSVSRVKDFQLIGLSLIIFWTLGMMASDLFCTGGEKARSPVITGLASGIATAFVFSSINVLVSPPFLFSWENGIFSIQTGTLFFRLIEWLILFSAFAITSGILQSIGAWHRHSRQELKQETVDVREKSSFYGMLYAYRFLILVLLALLIIPPVIVYAGITTGVIERDNPAYRPFDSVNVSRTEDESILILLNPDPECPQKEQGLRFVNITVDGKDVSTKSVIMNSGLNLSIDPPEGLLYRNNSSAILRGDYLSGNNTVLIRVDVIYTDLGFSDVIYNKTI
ncbi:hypothetical protein [Methanolacinia paynteri]|uniref:hypothetical protein n=1 Tax=Methanolacinia paynteri TaxID=230356 RepID=UPI00064F1949|nr:hypothetical protein [Methanolacinia paynteri]